MSEFTDQTGPPKFHFEVVDDYTPRLLMGAGAIIHPPVGPWNNPVGPDIELYRQRQLNRLKKGDLSDITRVNPTFPGGKIKIHLDPGSEPTFRHGRDGDGGEGDGDEPGEGDTEPEFEMSAEEFLKLFFPGLTLPNLRKKDTVSTKSVSDKIRGIQRNGPRARLDKRATAKARARRAVAMKNAQPDQFPEEGVPAPDKVPFAKNDLRYGKLRSRPAPDSKAVIFFVLDCSGSTSGEILEIMKNAFFAFYLFVRAQYENVEVVMIAHNDSAKRFTDSREFFGVRGSGGTQFLPAYRMTWEIAEKEFPESKWNRYIFQSTDGDTIGSESEEITKWWIKFINGGFNYGFYLEIESGWSSGGDFSVGGKAIKKCPANILEYIGMARIKSKDQIPAAFQLLFKKKAA